MTKVKRPWGYFIEYAPGYKSLHVSPHQALSLQKHMWRAEHWFIVRGEALVTVDNIFKKVRQGDVIDVPLESEHRISNITDFELVVFEVQEGISLEEDIIRLEDIYGRCSNKRRV